MVKSLLQPPSIWKICSWGRLGERIPRGSVHCSHLCKKTTCHLENTLQGTFAFKKFKANKLASTPKRVIISRDTNYPRMADVKSLLNWDWIFRGSSTLHSPTCYRASHSINPDLILLMMICHLAVQVTRTKLPCAFVFRKDQVIIRSFTYCFQCSPAWQENWKYWWHSKV